MDLITSRTNSTIRLAVSLRDRRRIRYRERLFFVEGIRTVVSLVQAGYCAKYLLIDADRVGEVPTDLVNTIQSTDGRLNLVDTDLFRELSDVETPQAVIGLLGMPRTSLPASPTSVLVIDGIQDPGNLGTILRTSAAAGVEAVVVGRGTVDPYSPKVIRSTAGAIGALPLAHARSYKDLVNEYPELPGRIIVADAKAPDRHWDVDWTKPFTLVVGNEGSGAGDDWRSAASESIRVDIEHSVESLNVSAATAALLFEARRQRMP